MIGAIAGDIIGSVYEWRPIKWTTFQPLFHPWCRFTDDTVMTCAVAEHLLDGWPLVSSFKSYYHRYPNAGYGGLFHQWAQTDDPRPYNSFGNGSAMRVSPVGFAFNTLDKVLEQAKKTAEVTHDHPEGIKGAQAVAAAIFLARTGSTKDEIEDTIARTFGYNFDRTLDEIRETYSFDVTCQGSVPQAILAFLESDDYEDAVRRAISLGGDSDTLACMAGGIAQAFYGGVPEPIVERVYELLDERLIAVVDRFRDHFDC